jgi:hypothetical protein
MTTAKRAAKLEHLHRLQWDPYYRQSTIKNLRDKRAKKAAAGAQPTNPAGVQKQVSMGGWSLNDAGLKFVGELQPVAEAADHMDHIENGLVVVDDTSVFAR